ncbi:hypothetical protein BC628DRAFT_1393411 [Trametes gibbosa]|nr:hypothetical protein BC628DRAFT_1393411 [Trametes gibbosa]
MSKHIVGSTWSGSNPCLGGDGPPIGFSTRCPHLAHNLSTVDSVATLTVTTQTTPTLGFLFAPTVLSLHRARKLVRWQSEASAPAAFLPWFLKLPLYVAGAINTGTDKRTCSQPISRPLTLHTAAKMLPLRAAGILSTTLEGILYGYAVFMFMLAMWIMLRDRKIRQVNYALVGAGCALMVLATAEMAVNIARIYRGFVAVGPFVPGGPEAWFSIVSDPTFVVKSVFYNTQTLILDAVVIYRTYIVWQSVLVVILPMIGWCGLLGGSIGLNVSLVNSSKHSGDVFELQTGRWITAVYALTLGTNLSSTLLLAGRIWTVTRRSAQYRSSDFLGPVLRVIIESGAIYSVTITAALISFVAKSNAVYVILDVISPIISIVFNMLIIRIGLASDRSFLGVAAAGVTGSTQATWAAAGSAPTSIDRTAARRRTDATYAMKDLKVEITQVIENDAEYTMVDAASPGGRSVRPRERRDTRVLRELQVDVNVDVDMESVSESPRSSVHDPGLDKLHVENPLV